MIHVLGASWSSVFDLILLVIHSVILAIIPKTFTNKPPEALVTMLNLIC